MSEIKYKHCNMCGALHLSTDIFNGKCIDCVDTPAINYDDESEFERRHYIDFDDLYDRINRDD
jgi:hypothetical protein